MIHLCNLYVWMYFFKFSLFCVFCWRNVERNQSCGIILQLLGVGDGGWWTGADSRGQPGAIPPPHLYLRRRSIILDIYNWQNSLKTRLKYIIFTLKVDYFKRKSGPVSNSVFPAAAAARRGARKFSARFAREFSRNQIFSHASNSALLLSKILYPPLVVEAL